MIKINVLIHRTGGNVCYFEYASYCNVFRNTINIHVRFKWIIIIENSAPRPLVLHCCLYVSNIRYFLLVVWWISYVNFKDRSITENRKKKSTFWSLFISSYVFCFRRFKACLQNKTNDDSITGTLILCHFWRIIEFF